MLCRLCARIVYVYELLIMLEDIENSLRNVK